MFFSNRSAFGAQSNNATNNNNTNNTNTFQTGGMTMNSANIGVLDTHHGNFSFGVSTQPTLFSPTQPPSLPPPQYSIPFTNIAPTLNSTLTNNQTYFASFPPNQQQEQQKEQKEEEHRKSEIAQTSSNISTFNSTPTSSNVQGHSAFAPAASTFAKSAFSLHPTTVTSSTATANTNINTNVNTMAKVNNSSVMTSSALNNTQPVLSAASVFGANSVFVSSKPNTISSSSSSKLVFGNNSVLPFSPVAQNVTHANITTINNNNNNMTSKENALTENPLTQTLADDKEKGWEQEELEYEVEEEEEEEEEHKSERESLEREKEEKETKEKEQPSQASNRNAFTNTVFASTTLPNVIPPPPLQQGKQESVFKQRRTQFLYSSSFSAQDTSKPNAALTSSTTITNNTPFVAPWQHKEFTSSLREKEEKQQEEQSQRAPPLSSLVFTSNVSRKGNVPSFTFPSQDKSHTHLSETSSSSLQTHTSLPLHDSELCLLSRVFASFVETMIKLSSGNAHNNDYSSNSNSNSTQMLCASLHRQVELALFGVAGQVGVYAEYDKMVNELLAVWERGKQQNTRTSTSLPLSLSKTKSPSPSGGMSFGASNSNNSIYYNNNNNNNSNNIMWSKVRGELWVLIFALGSQVNFIIHTLQEYLENQFQLSNNNVDSNSNKLNEASTMTSNKHISYELYTLKKSIIASAEDALNDACEYANQLGQFALELYQRDGDETGNINTSSSNSNNNNNNLDNVETGYYVILPLLLQRTRSTFEAATALGLPNPRSSSNMRSITSKLFSLLNKRIKQSVVTVIPVPQSTTLAGLSTTLGNNSIIANNNNNNVSPSSPSTLTFTNYNTHDISHKQWRLTWRSEGQRQLIIAFANVVAEMMMSDAPTNEEVEMFISAFHEALPCAHAERCKLYECQANQLFMQPLTMSVVRQASHLLAHALVTLQCTQNENNNSSSSSSSSSIARINKSSFIETHRSLALKLTTAQLALGKLPHISLLEELCTNENNSYTTNSTITTKNQKEDNNNVSVEKMFAFPELDDVMMAVRSANMTLYELALRNNAMYYVQNGIHNALCFVRKRIALLMVVKFYMYKQCDSRLRVPEMIAFHNLHYVTLFEAMTSWLLPLLVEKFINGVLDNDSLVLSEANPFDDYSKAELLQGARNFTSSVNTK